MECKCKKPAVANVVGAGGKSVPYCMDDLLGLVKDIVTAGYPVRITPLE